MQMVCLTTTTASVKPVELNQHLCDTLQASQRQLTQYMCTGSSNAITLGLADIQDCQESIQPKQQNKLSSISTPHEHCLSAKLHMASAQMIHCGILGLSSSLVKRLLQGTAEPKIMRLYYMLSTSSLTPET